MADSITQSDESPDREAGQHIPSKKQPYVLPKWYDPEISAYTPEEYAEMFKLYDETMEDIKEGEVVSGRVVAIGSGDIVVDIGFKSEGTVALSEFADPEELAVGDAIEVFLESLEDREGQPVISKKKADFMKVWSDIKEASESGAVVRGQALRRIKGGMVVDLFGVDAFMPGSQLAIKHISNLDTYIGQHLAFKIIKLNKSRRNIVVSRRAVLEAEREEQRKKTMAELEKGQVRKGVIKNITDFGAFIDLGGIDGLLHLTDFSWGRIKHPSDVVKIGQEIDVAILDYDRDRERVSLGLKQLKTYPWANVETRYPVNTVVNGLVINVKDYGAFIELEEGVEGLVHISEMAWAKHVSHPLKVVKPGQHIDVKVLSVNTKDEKISLSIKHTQPDPWETLDQRYPVGTITRGKVRNITEFGVFVTLEDGIDGLVHISDLSWTRRFDHPDEMVRKGQEIDVKILDSDKNKRRISLGIKQLIEDPWDDMAKVYTTETETSGRVVRLLDQGVVIELPNAVEGFVPVSHLNHPNIKRPSDAFKVGDRLPLKVIEMDTRKRRIVLSVKAYLRDREQVETERFIKEHPPVLTVIEDTMDLETEIEVAED